MRFHLGFHAPSPVTDPVLRLGSTRLRAALASAVGDQDLQRALIALDLPEVDAALARVPQPQQAGGLVRQLVVGPGVPTARPRWRSSSAPGSRPARGAGCRHRRPSRRPDSRGGLRRRPGYPSGGHPATPDRSGRVPSRRAAPCGP
ncbi:hypothetical protein ACWCYZ_37895 [Streptomyces virginiae]